MDNQLDIENNVFIDYFLLQQEIYRKAIINEIEEASIINFESYSKVIRFKEKNCIIFKCIKNVVKDFSILDYEYILSTSFLNKLISQKDLLNFRVARYADKQYINILKQEIVNALVLKRIKLTYDCKKRYVIGDWEKLGIKFVLSEDMRFIDFTN